MEVAEKRRRREGAAATAEEVARRERREREAAAMVVVVVVGGGEVWPCGVGGVGGGCDAFVGSFRTSCWTGRLGWALVYKWAFATHFS